MGLFYIDLDKETTERFDFSKFCEYTNGEYDNFTSSFLIDLKKLATENSYTVTYEEDRIDLISYKIYGSTQYWWILIEYNAILDPFTIPNGTIINYPSLQDLQLLLFNLKAKETSK
jgi:hypothetical protein